MVLQEIADADGPYPARIVEVFECPPGILVFPLHRPVDQVQVQVIEAQVVHGAVKSLQGALIALVGIPDLAGDKHLFPVHAALPEGFPNPGLVPISPRRIDMPVAGFQGPLHGPFHLPAFFSLVNPQPEVGHLHPVIQFKCSLYVCNCTHRYIL